MYHVSATRAGPGCRFASERLRHHLRRKNIAANKTKIAETDTATAMMIAVLLECEPEEVPPVAVPSPAGDTRLEQVNFVLASALNNLDDVPQMPFASLTATTKEEKGQAVYISMRISSHTYYLCVGVDIICESKVRGIVSQCVVVNDIRVGLHNGNFVWFTPSAYLKLHRLASFYCARDVCSHLNVHRRRLGQTRRVSVFI